MIYQGECLNVLKTLKTNSIDCCVTSPPYWGLRDYGDKNQRGLEPSPAEFVEKLVLIFQEVKRVLKNNGTLWLNLGDSYAAGTKGTGGKNSPKHKVKGELNFQEFSSGTRKFNLAELGLKSKDLVGIPWRVAFALQRDGWFLRQDIIWAKKNPMPESVKDRFTKSHEHVFLLSKNKSYYFDYKSVQEPALQSSVERTKRPWSGNKERGMLKGFSPHSFKYYGHGSSHMRRKRDVWFLTSEPFKGAHFATFPTKLIEPCILAGCPEGGVVLDPFFGAGTTGYVAKKLNRQYIGIEINQDYIEIAKKRIERVPLFPAPWRTA